MDGAPAVTGGGAISNIQAKASDEHKIYWLAITIVLGGHLVGWNNALKGGFTDCAFGLFITSALYINLTLCLAEMSSMLPFSGGSYGFARVTMGTYLGYMVGASESLQYIMYTAASVELLGLCVTEALSIPKSYGAFVWIAFYMSATAVLSGKVNPFWMCSTALGVLTMMFLLIYVFITPVVNEEVGFERYAREDGDAKPFGQDITTLMRYLPYTAWFFVGIECIPLVSSDVKKPKTAIPKAMVAAVCILTVIATGVLFSTCSQRPGVKAISLNIFPLNDGYAHLFGMPGNISSLFNVVGLYATSFGFLFAFGKQSSAMAGSGLLWSQMGTIHSVNRTPYVAYIVGSSLSCLTVLVRHLIDENVDWVFQLCVLSTSVVYVSMFYAFYSFRTHFGNLDRKFVNPLGIPGAILGALVALLYIVSLLGFQTSPLSAIMFSCSFIVFTLYYYFFARHWQFFSKNEQDVLLVAYIMKGNREKRKSTSQRAHKRKLIPKASTTGRYSVAKVAVQNGPDSNGTELSLRDGHSDSYSYTYSNTGSSAPPSFCSEPTRTSEDNRSISTNCKEHPAVPAQGGYNKHNSTGSPVFINNSGASSRTSSTGSLGSGASDAYVQLIEVLTQQNNTSLLELVHRRSAKMNQTRLFLTDTEDISEEELEHSETVQHQQPQQQKDTIDIMDNTEAGPTAIEKQNERQLEQQPQQQSTDVAQPAADGAGQGNIEL